MTQVRVPPLHLHDEQQQHTSSKCSRRGGSSPNTALEDAIFSGHPRLAASGQLLRPAVMMFDDEHLDVVPGLRHAMERYQVLQISYCMPLDALLPLSQPLHPLQPVLHIAYCQRSQLFSNDSTVTRLTKPLLRTEVAVSAIQLYPAAGRSTVLDHGTKGFSQCNVLFNGTAPDSHPYSQGLHRTGDEMLWSMSDFAHRWLNNEHCLL